MTDAPTTYDFVTVDAESGKIDASILPDAVPLISSTTGQLDPSIVPSVGGGGGGGTTLMSIDFSFPGELTPRTGTLFWYTPAFALTPIRLSASLGTLPTIGYTPPGVTLRLNLNGFEIGRLVFSGVSSSVQGGLTLSGTIPPNSTLSADIVSVPASTPTKAGDALMQLLVST